VRKSYELKGYC